MFATQPLSTAEYPLLPADSLIRTGITHLYQYDRDEALEVFGKVIKHHPGHPAAYYLSGVTAWMQQRGLRGIPPSEDTLLARMKRTAKIAKSYTSDHPEDPYGYLMHGLAQGTRARVDLARQHWLKAVVHGYEGIHLIQKAADINGNIPDLQMAFGAFHYYVGMSGWLTRVAASLVGLSGNTREGKAELRYAAEHSRYATPEAHGILLFINGYLEDSLHVALLHAETLNQKYPGNPYYQALRGDLEFAAGNPQETQHCIWRLQEIIPELGPYDQKNYRAKVTYLRGLLAYEQSRYATAIPLLESYLKKGIDEYDFFALNAKLYLGKCYLKQEEDQQARKYFSAVADEKIPGRIREEARRLLNEG